MSAQRPRFEATSSAVSLGNNLHCDGDFTRIIRLCITSQMLLMVLVLMMTDDDDDD